MQWTLIVIIAVSCSLLATTCIVYYIVLHWRRKGKYALSQYDRKDDRQNYKYIVKPSKKCKFEFEDGIPHNAGKPVNVQPNSAKLNLRLFEIYAEKTDSFETGIKKQSPPEVYQTPLISNYENMDRKSFGWRKNFKAKRNLKDSYGSSSSTIIDTATIVSTTKPDTNANFAENVGTSADPELNYSIFYDSPTRDLHITVIASSNLPISKWAEETKSTQSFRVKVRVEPLETLWRETGHARGTREARFCETFIVSGLVHHKLRECTVRFAVVEFEEYQHCWAVVGELSQTLIDLRANQLMKATKKLQQT